jgi:hypothetical protein
MPLVSAAGGSVRVRVRAEELHRDQRPKGKPVPSISHLIAVRGQALEGRGTEEQAIASLLMAAADKPHNAHDMLLDARRDPGSWSRFNGGLEGAAWYLLRMHQP